MFKILKNRGYECKLTTEIGSLTSFSVSQTNGVIQISADKVFLKNDTDTECLMKHYYPLTIEGDNTFHKNFFLEHFQNSSIVNNELVLENAIFSNEIKVDKEDIDIIKDKFQDFSRFLKNIENKYKIINYNVEIFDVQKNKEMYDTLERKVDLFLGLLSQKDVEVEKSYIYETVCTCEVCNTEKLIDDVQETFDYSDGQVKVMCYKCIDKQTKMFLKEKEYNLLEQLKNIDPSLSKRAQWEKEELECQLKKTWEKISELNINNRKITPLHKNVDE